jgi:hypothetical protein
MGQREDEADDAWTEHGDSPQILDDQDYAPAPAPAPRKPPSPKEKTAMADLDKLDALETALKNMAIPYHRTRLVREVMVSPEDLGFVLEVVPELIARLTEQVRVAREGLAGLAIYPGSASGARKIARETLTRTENLDEVAAATVRAVIAAMQPGTPEE